MTHVSSCLVAPIFALPAALYELAHWYRVEGYQAALQRHGIVETLHGEEHVMAKNTS